MFKKLFLIGLCWSLIETKDPTIEEEEFQARNFLRAINQKTAENENKVALANWAYVSNLTDENLKHQVGINSILICRFN